MTMDLVETRSEGIHTPDYFYDFGGGVPGALAEGGELRLESLQVWKEEYPSHGSKCTVEISINGHWTDPATRCNASPFS